MIAALAIATAYAASLLLRTLLARAYARSIDGEACPPLAGRTLTLAQPILSGDPLLESRLAENLAALPGQVFLWLIDEEDAEALRIAGKLRSAHPAVELQLELCPPCPDATNPKLWKLQRAAMRVGTPYFGVLDDDTVLSAASAARLVAAAARHTIATGLPCYEATRTGPSALLAQFVNNNSVFTYLGTSRLLAPFTINGMGYVLRREELPKLENFAPILHELTDDLALATLVLQRGGSIHQSCAPLRVLTGVRNFTHYLQFMHRWYLFTLLLLRRQSPAVQGLIFLLHGLPPLLFVSLFLVTLCHPSLLGGALLPGVLLLRTAVLGNALRRFFGPGLHRPPSSIASELLQPLHLLHAICYRTIRWRTRRYRVRDSDDFSAV